MRIARLLGTSSRTGEHIIAIKHAAITATEAAKLIEELRAILDTLSVPYAPPKPA